jgi:hypothetical protein
LPETAGLLQFISFSTSYRELDSAVRPLMRRIGAAESTRFTAKVFSFSLRVPFVLALIISPYRQRQP